MADQYILLISHYRARSTLLAHILGSHQEISGYSEIKIQYLGIEDLPILRTKVSETLDGEYLNRLILDKLVDLNIKVCPEILNHPDVKVIFLLRRPEPTINSILGFNLKRTLQVEFMFAIQYYRERLEQFSKYAHQLQTNSLFIESDQIIENSDQVFLLIQQFLGLKTPLSKEYKTFKLTGVPGRGDPSPNIHAGKVLNETNHRTFVKFTPAMNILMEQAYKECKEDLLQRCLHI